jgi:DNA-binding transcriptional LysR family regulator
MEVLVQKRYESKNIPIEILRSFVTVVETGSYTKAGELLNLSQAAVSAQIARLRRILRGELFTRGAERQLTSRGAIVLSYARRIVAMNDQLIATAGPKPAPRQLLVGLPRWYDYQRLVELIRSCSNADVPEKVTFRCGDMAEFTRDLNTGSIDIAFMVNPSEQPGRPIYEWHEPMHWTKSPRLVLSPHEPVPLVGWPGTLSERLATKLLSDAQLSYDIVFTGADNASRKAAVAAGLGLMLMMTRAMTPDVVIAKESFLPPAPIIKTGIYAREGLNIRRIMPLVQILEGLLRPPTDSEVVAAPAGAPPGEKPARRRRRA